MHASHTDSVGIRLIVLAVAGGGGHEGQQHLLQARWTSLFVFICFFKVAVNKLNSGGAYSASGFVVTIATNADVSTYSRKSWVMFLNLQLGTLAD